MMKFTVGQENLASKLLIPVKGLETPEELYTLLDQSPALTRFSDEYLIRHTVSKQLRSELYENFGVGAEFSYGFYTGLLSHLGYTFTPSEEMFAVLKRDLITLFGAPHTIDNEYSLHWHLHGGGKEYGCKS